VPGNPKEFKLKGFLGFPDTEVAAPPAKSKAAAKQESKSNKKSKLSS
jgi:predicted small lipoprotein YifL